MLQYSGLFIIIENFIGNYNFYYYWVFIIMDYPQFYWKNFKHLLNLDYEYFYRNVLILNKNFSLLSIIWIKKWFMIKNNF
jgi:hypothetical protein